MELPVHTSSTTSAHCQCTTPVQCRLPYLHGGSRYNQGASAARKELSATKAMTSHPSSTTPPSTPPSLAAGSSSLVSSYLFATPVCSFSYVFGRLSFLCVCNAVLSYVFAMLCLAMFCDDAFSYVFAMPYLPMSWLYSISVCLWLCCIFLCGRYAVSSHVFAMPYLTTRLLCRVRYWQCACPTRYPVLRLRMTLQRGGSSLYGVQVRHMLLRV